MRVHVLWSSLFILLTVALLQIQTGSSPSAHEYDHDGGDGLAFEMDEHVGIVNLGVSLTRRPELGNEYVALSLSLLDYSINSCIEFSDYEYEMKYQDMYLEIELKGFDVKNENMPLHPHYECDGKQQDRKLEIILNREDLKEKGTKLIKFASGPAFEYFDLTLTDEKIQLIPSETHKAKTHFFKPKKTYGRKDAMKLWIYPENTLILYLPGTMLGSEKEAEKVIDEVAARSGLVPLTDILTDFETPLTKAGHYYFVDKSGLVAARMETDGGVLLDNVKIRASSYELEQDVPLLKNIPVYAKKPGTNE